MPEPTTPFGAASTGAMADIAAYNASEPASPTPPEPTAPAAPAPEPESAAPAAAPPPSEPREQIVWQGKTIEVTKDELKALAQKGFDYSQKTMTVAEIKKELDAEKARYADEKAEIIAFLKDPVRVQQYAQALAVQAGVPATPEEIPTAAQVQQLLQQQAKHLHEQTVREIQQAKAETTLELEARRLEVDYRAEVERTLAAVTNQHKALATFYDEEDLHVALKQDAWKQIQAKQAVDPDYIPSPADVRGFLATAAARRAAKVEARLTDHTKMAAVRAAKTPTSPAIEPPGGGAVPPPPPGKTLKLGSPELRALVMADLAAAERARRET